MEFLTGTFIIVAILFMSVFMFIGIWSFVVYLKSYRQSRYQNYILEKIHQKLTSISDKMSESDSKNNNYSYLTGEEDIFEIEENTKDINNISNFEKQEKFKAHEKK